MENLAQTIRNLHVEAGSVAIFWLGQAGFAFKTSGGQIVYVDPYFSDYVQRVQTEHSLDYKRIMPKLIEADEANADAIISTHSHEDHLDADALPVLAQNPRIHFFGAPDCETVYVRAGLSPDRFTIYHRDERLRLGDCTLRGVYADHGTLAPDALGLLLDFDGIHIWQVGDSAYRPDMWRDLVTASVDILIPPINGAFGNLNEREAAQLARDVHAKVVIPCHFWMFVGHFGNPAGFLRACRELAPEVQVQLMTQGEGYVYHK